MPTTMDPANDVLPVFQDFSVQADAIEGRVIALQKLGSVLNYLVLDAQTEKPIWVQEHEITRAYG